MNHSGARVDVWGHSSAGVGVEVTPKLQCLESHRCTSRCLESLQCWSRCLGILRSWSRSLEQVFGVTLK